MNAFNIYCFSRSFTTVLACWIITFETYWEIVMWKKTEKGAK